jgi:HAD superfamily hydrolase (TIGR01509 family)
MSTSIRTIIFDFFGVVVAFDEDLVYRKIALQCPDPDKTQIALRGLLSTPSLIEDYITLKDVHEQLVATHGFMGSFQAFREIWVTPYSTPMPGVAELIDELSVRFRLILLSNVDRYYFEAIRALYPELQHFAVQLVSYEMGFSKPSELAFSAAVHAGQAQAHECFFVDDKAENIDAASKLGIRGHLFTSTRAFRAALATNGVVTKPSDG